SDVASKCAWDNPASPRNPGAWWPPRSPWPQGVHSESDGEVPPVLDIVLHRKVHRDQRRQNLAIGITADDHHQRGGESLLRIDICAEVAGLLAAIEHFFQAAHQFGGEGYQFAAFGN